VRRSAFTWIELIFVIVILGIIASVAIVKMGGMTERANEIKLKAMVGSLNRSSGAGFWFTSMNDGNDGSVAFKKYSDVFDQYMTLVPGYINPPALLEACIPKGDGVMLKYQYTDLYHIICIDGDAQTSPKFRLYNKTTGKYID